MPRLGVVIGDRSRLFGMVTRSGVAACLAIAEGDGGSYARASIEATPALVGAARLSLIHKLY